VNFFVIAVNLPISLWCHTKSYAVPMGNKYGMNYSGYRYTHPSSFCPGIVWGYALKWAMITSFQLFIGSPFTVVIPSHWTLYNTTLLHILWTNQLYLESSICSEEISQKVTGSTMCHLQGTIRYIKVIRILGHKKLVLDNNLSVRQIWRKLHIAGSGEGRNNIKYSPW
jgi:hypothetical protein